MLPSDNIFGLLRKVEITFLQPHAGVRCQRTPDSRLSAALLDRILHNTSSKVD